MTEPMGRSLLYALVGAVITLTIVRSASIAATLRAVDVEIAEVLGRILCFKYAPTVGMV